MSGEKDAEMTKRSTDDGIHVEWHLDVIEKDERIEVIYELHGDPSTEYKVSETQTFHGATFGDELDELPAPEPVVGEQEAGAEAVEESPAVTEADAEVVEESEPEQESEPADQEMADTMARISFSNDEGAEEAQESADASVETEEEEVEEEEVEEEEVEEEEVEEDQSAEPNSAEQLDERTCPICNAANAAGASFCETCSFTFGEE
jgi:hypothetical protein